ncbi:MAG: hypothetical protein HY699_08705 [Deltaproteobacteria bacterium]|nr:hypothetical protein [Deltaproteobacteria bacterium]
MSVLLVVRNDTGTAVTAVRPSSLDINATDGVSFTISNGPAPGVYNLLASGNRATFKWNGQLSGAGNVIISVGASGFAAGGAEVATGTVDCGAVGIEAPPVPAFDPNQLIGLCTATVVDGKVLVSFRLEVFNGTGAELTNLTPFGPDIETTGSVELTMTTGPEPGSLRLLRADRRARFKWQGYGGGRGLAFIHVGVNATGPNGEAVSTGVIECNTLVVPPKPRG